VLSVSYSGGLRHSSDGIVDMYIIGENLLSDLIQDGVGQVPHCPVVLVGHSIGGLVIKELCRRAHNKFNSCQGYDRAKLEMFLKNIGGIFYYATPHRGSGIAEILAKKISSPLLTYFETLSYVTARLNSEFEAICKAHYKDWLFAGLGETLPTNLVCYTATVGRSWHAS
jgi:pimeloyl-ACP methyl ester carboxylesterase